MLDAVDRVAGAIAIVEGERQPLDVIEQLRPEIPNQFFAGVGLQVPARQPLQIHQRSDSYQQPHRDSQGGGFGMGAGEHSLQEWGKRRFPEDAVDRDLQRQRIEKSKRKRK